MNPRKISALLGGCAALLVAVVAWSVAQRALPSQPSRGRSGPAPAVGPKDPLVLELRRLREELSGIRAELGRLRASAEALEGMARELEASRKELQKARAALEEIEDNTDARYFREQLLRGLERLNRAVERIAERI